MIKIAFLIRSLDYGGAERHLLNLARFLDKERFDVTVLYFYPGGRLESELRESNVRLVSLDKKGRWDLPGFLWRLARQLRALRPSVLHSFLVERPFKTSPARNENHLGRARIRHQFREL
jgi:glycosyltransferase involved in cell wall biosynthesis